MNEWSKNRLGAIICGRDICMRDRFSEIIVRLGQPLSSPNYRYFVKKYPEIGGHQKPVRRRNYLILNPSFTSRSYRSNFFEIIYFRMFPINDCEPNADSWLSVLIHFREQRSNTIRSEHRTSTNYGISLVFAPRRTYTGIGYCARGKEGSPGQDMYSQGQGRNYSRLCLQMHLCR